VPAAWKGTISFGLVNIPITLYPAFKSREMEFHLLHRADHGRIGYQKVCKKCGRVLAPDDIVKAYEHEKDAYVPLEKEELDAGKAPNTRTLEISLFVPEGDIDAKLYERPYYVMPGKNAEAPYVLLREAIRASGRVGVGKIQFGNREHLAALKADGPAILLNLMHFLDEMEDVRALNFPAADAAVGKRELELARQLVSALAGRFEAGEFRDAHRARLEKTLEEKVAKAARSRKRKAAGAADGKIVDLMARLKASLDGKPQSGTDWSPAPRAGSRRAAGPKAAGTSRGARGSGEGRNRGRSHEEAESAERQYRRRKAG
jgi:DNA end-binding protein Ku